MKATTGGLAGLAAFTALALACNPDKGPVGLIPPTFDRLSEASSAPLVQHIVAPQATDPAIDQALDNHYAWLDTTGRTNHKLFVFMPGTGLTPAVYQLVQQEAARVGYHVIDRSPWVDVNAANSIDNRLTKLLQYLARQYPDEGWDRFLAHDKPKWSQMAVSGHSQGGGHAAMIAKIRLVARVVMFSSVTDSLQGASVPWVATHVTPSDRYYGFDHDLDEQFRSIRASWDSLGMAAFGPAVAPENSAPPYDFTHMLVTDYHPLRGPGRPAHSSSCTDFNTPLAADGTPVFLDAWRYLLTTRSSDEDDTDDETSSASAARRDPS